MRIFSIIFLSAFSFFPGRGFAQINSWDASMNKAASVNNTRIIEPVRVDYTPSLVSKKVKGSFIKIAPDEWVQVTDQDSARWLEIKRSDGGIYLSDTARKMDIVINPGKRQIFRAGSMGNSALYTILDVKRGVVQKNPAPDSQGQSANAKNEGNPNPAIVKNDPPSENRITTGTDDLNKDPVYHAILIAEDKYREAGYHSLPGTVRDVQKIYQLLTSKYTFEPGNIEILLNASKERILSKMNEKGKSLTDKDNLFIYYAGHGWIKKYPETGREEGFLIPSDAVKGDEVSFINSYDITTIINRCKAKHILFAADACFAGSLFRDIPSESSQGAKEAYRDKSRRLLSSGNLQAVSDESDFVESFRLALQENREKYVTAGKLIDSFKEQYIEKTHMQLQYSPIPNVDDQGGEFVFIQR